MGNSLALRIRRVLGVIAVVAVAWAWAGAAQGAELVGEIVSASGPVEIRPLGQGVWRVASRQAVLQPGDMLRTGPGGAAEVAFVSGVVRLDENTVIVLPPPKAAPASTGAPSGVRLLLQGGRALFRVLKDRLEGTFDVITPSIIVGVKGTTFGVEHGPNLGVVVFEGIVEVAQVNRLDLPPVHVRAGQYTVLLHGQLIPPRGFEHGRPGLVWHGAPTKTSGNALPAGADQRLVPRRPATVSGSDGGPSGSDPGVELPDAGTSSSRGQNGNLPGAAAGVPGASSGGASSGAPSGPTNGGSVGTSTAAPPGPSGGVPQAASSVGSAGATVGGGATTSLGGSTTTSLGGGGTAGAGGATTTNLGGGPTASLGGGATTSLGGSTTTGLGGGTTNLGGSSTTGLGGGTTTGLGGGKGNGGVPPGLPNKPGGPPPGQAKK